MHGGRHHGPSVVTHFFPGMLAGFVLGGIVGAIVVTHIASTSLKFFWQSAQQELRTEQKVCSDIAGVRITEERTDAGGVMSAVTIGDGRETLLTVAKAQLRYVPSTDSSEAYLTAVASVEQQEAFPALSLYRLDYCTKTLTHILGGGTEERTILSLSEGGMWVAYMAEGEFMLMHTDDGRAWASGLDVRPDEIRFSPREHALAVRYGGETREVWYMEENMAGIQKIRGIPGATLPAWNMSDKDEYSVEIQ